MTPQKTLASEVRIEGIGQHRGTENSLLVRPAPANCGIVFSIGGREFPLSVENVYGEAGYTTIGDPKGENLKTVEHLLSAIHALGLDNLLVETASEEVPILDGSALPFVKLLEKAGFSPQNASKKAIRILKKIEFKDDKAEVSLEPAKTGLHLDITIDYPDIKPIGRQEISFVLTPENYKRLAAPARSFARLSDVEYLHSRGLALGASMATGIAVDEERVLNHEGLRLENEFVAHKVLDAVGDLFVAGKTLVGRYKSVRGGHYHNNMLMRALLSDPANYEVVEI
ncbi:MAG: UDP-3-O-acyl-N-acetylglucosamine deacetylase [Rickettsiales bacterium]|jgi:UDP-3-O-[3-hydroxymyristoyl] N-acetylglucosamine deacetylase|nr:UDP-3-O-acyl-N-acetylglucosamine deacetylase [Rickettsiales bacterium]